MGQFPNAKDSIEATLGIPLMYEIESEHEVNKMFTSHLICIFSPSSHHYMSDTFHIHSLIDPIISAYVKALK